MNKIIILVLGFTTTIGLAQETGLVNIGKGQNITEASYRIMKDGFVDAAVNIYGEAYDETDSNTFLRSKMRKNLAIAAFNEPDNVLKDKIESIILFAGLVIIDNIVYQPDGTTPITASYMTNSVYSGLWDLMSGYVKQNIIVTE